MTDDTAKTKDLAKQNKRLAELEISVSHLENTVDKLNDVVARQDKLLSEQQVLIKKLAQKFEATKSEGGITTFDVAADRPPHY